MKIGEYIRTPYGIRKIVDIKKDDGYGKPKVKIIVVDDILISSYMSSFEFYTDDRVFKNCKHDKSIIKIIEKEDLVVLKSKECKTEIYKVANVCNNFVEVDCFQDGTMEVYENDISFVVTHNEFDRIKYKINNEKGE